MKHFSKLVVAIALGYFIYVLLYGTPDLKQPTQLEIPKGASVGEIALKLKDADLIRSKLGFQSLVWFKGVSQKLQAGEYSFEDKMSLADIVRMLTQGLGALNEKQFTIIEGWGKDEIVDYFKERGVMEKEDFTAIVRQGCQAAGVDCEDFQFLSDKPSNIGLEGYLFPDTYRVFKDANAQDVIVRLLENFDSKLTPEMRNDITEQGKKIFDVVRMASIVEAEVPHEEDRPIVAGILWKRLDANMALQVDSTLNYATGGKNAALTREELAIDSPYNTYKYRGLPPTPIGNPGLSALRAAIYPTHTAYWYFLSDEDGVTHFGRTLEEHNANKAQYLK